MNASLTSEALSRKEREKRARQQDILNAAQELFAAKGFRETTLDEIAQRAEFGKGTLYNYFGSKEDIFHALIDQLLGNSLAMAQECAASDADIQTKLTRYARSSMEYVRTNGELFHAIVEELHRGRKSEPSRLQDVFNRSQTVANTIGTILRKGMDAGTIRQGNPTDFVTMLDDMIRGVASRQILMHGTLTPEELDRQADLIVSIFLDGITVRHSKG